MKRLLTALFFCATSQCFAAAIGIGFAEATPDGALYLYTSEKVEDSTTVRVKLGIDRGADCCRLLFGRDFQKVDPVDSVMGDREVARYRLTKRDSSQAAGRAIGIAIVDASSAANRGDDVVAMAGGKRYVLRSCLGAEGVNLKALRSGRVVDDLYFALGYDVSPTCSDKNK